MKNSKTVISIAENVNGIVEGHQCHIFNEPSEAKAFILRNLKEESKELDTPLEPYEGDINSLTSSAEEGNFSYTIGDHEYHIAFYKEKGEYKVTEEELTETLEHYCNCSLTNYPKAASLIVTKIHRYVQNELWKLIKTVIRAYSAASFDERNASAHRQCELISVFMDDNNM